MTQKFALIRVLVVDDDETQRELMLTYLQKLGITNCLTAADGKEALALLNSQNNFHVVFTDNQMPVLDGPELILSIRSNSTFDHIKVAMVSGNLSDRVVKSLAENVMRKFLKEHDVLPIPKEGLNANILGHALEAMTGQ